MNCISDFAVNGRILMLRSNGQRRVAEELIARLPTLQQVCPPRHSASGFRGHLWEQIVLPLLVGRRPLWSPSTSGPVIHPNQLVTIHDLAFIDCPQFFSRRFAAWYRLMVPGLIRRARHIVTVSEFTRRRVIDEFHITPEKVTTIYSGVAASFRERSAIEVQTVLHRLGIRRHRYVVGFVGCDPRKNTPALLRAWNDLGESRKGFSLVLFGRAANRAVFAKEKVQMRLPDVITAADMDDDALAALFSGAAGFAFPSLYEGFGLPVVEASRCGCRILTSNVSALPEVSPSDSVLVDPSRIRSIGEGLQQIIHEGDNATLRDKRIAQSQRFSWEIAARCYTELFVRFSETQQS